MDLNLFNGRVFYNKNNGQIYECFNDKPMIEVNKEIVNELLFNSRKRKVNFIVISENQVDILKQSLESKEFLNNMPYSQITISSYYYYGILSDEEYKILKSKLY